MVDRPRSGERALLVRIGLGSPVVAAELAEFDALARSAGAIPVGSVTGSRSRPDPRYFVGSGKAEELKARAFCFWLTYCRTTNPCDSAEREFPGSRSSLRNRS